MSGILDGKTAIVTGAGRGLGRAMTLGLLDAGARVAAVELDAPALDETQDAAEDRGAGDRYFGMLADVAWDDTGPKATRATVERFGRVDILINNAGINTALLRREGQPIGKIWETTPQEFRRIIEVNVVGAFLMTRAVLPALLAQRFGRIRQRQEIMEIVAAHACEAQMVAVPRGACCPGAIANSMVSSGANAGFK